MTANIPLECVAFMLIADRRILVEKRSASKRLLPGAIAIPGGHVDMGETLADALVRELHEELNITPQRFAHVCTRLHQAEEFRRIHYFAVTQWIGEIHVLEATSIHWLPLDDLSTLVLDIDRTAVAEYLQQISPTK